MSFSFYMNMEKLSVMIAKEHIDHMTNDNMDLKDGCIIDADRLLNNIKNGFICITQMNCYMESFLNTIISSCIGYEGETLLKCSHEEKFDIIFLHYHKDFAEIKAQNAWALYKKTTKVRNEMIHFKKTYVGEGTAVPDFKLAGEYVKDFFTQDQMKILLNAHIELAERIAKTLELTISDSVDVLACDGRDGLVNYIYVEKTTDIDESRFEG